MYLRLLALLLLISSLGGCSSPREQAVSTLQDTEASTLREEAARVYKEHRKRGATDYFALKSTVWPEPFKKFKPLRIGIYSDGIALALEGDAANERGIHIVPAGMSLSRTTGRVKYEQLADGIYWYALGK